MPTLPDENVEQRLSRGLARKEPGQFDDDRETILTNPLVAAAIDGPGDRPRSFDRFEREDLDFLVRVARADIEEFERRHRHHAGLSTRLLCIALCQGAARHLVEGRGGVHDFDVWSFFRAGEGFPTFPERRRKTAVFEGSRFQASSRRIDLLGRSIEQVGDARQSVATYLAAGRTCTAWELSRRPIYVLHPEVEHPAIAALRPEAIA